jgi:hypothetical protein
MNTNLPTGNFKDISEFTQQLHYFIKEESKGIILDQVTLAFFFIIFDSGNQAGVESEETYDGIATLLKHAKKCYDLSNSKINAKRKSNNDIS